MASKLESKAARTIGIRRLVLRTEETKRTGMGSRKIGEKLVKNKVRGVGFEPTNAYATRS